MHLSNNTLLQGGKYKIVRFIASGGFGCTYEAHHTLLDLRVALKEFFVSDFCNRDEATGQVTVATKSKLELIGKLKKKFMGEARALYKMKHPGIVRVIDVFEENGTAYYAMEYIDGQSLSDVVKKRSKLPEAEAVGYIRQVAEALKYVHGLNRLHLDIKPGNIMLNKDGKAVLIDFGASKHYDDETGENTSTLLGINTKGYAPVEQVNQSFKSFSPATDIYALGATLYKLLTGITPPPSNMLNSDEATLTPLPSSISLSTRKAVESAMQLLRKNRPQLVGEWIAMLVDDDETFVDIVEPEPQPVPKPRPIHKPLSAPNQESTKKSRLKWIISGVVAVIIIAVIGMVISLRDNDDTLSKSDSVSEPLGSVLQITANGVTFKMIGVDGGTFTMGATSEQQDPGDDEKPTHHVTLSSYYIGETEVTQALWKAVMGNTVRDQRDKVDTSCPIYGEGDNYPMCYVSWNDCQEFILKLNELTNRKFRLPTEAEWEFAARGGNKSRHTQYSGSGDIDEVGWSDGVETHPVKTKKANELGIYDMSGNVSEWCQDRYSDYSSGAQTNPTGATSGIRRVYRGGGWWDSRWRCRSSYRYCLAPDERGHDLGFRLVLSE